VFLSIWNESLFRPRNVTNESVMSTVNEADGHRDSDTTDERKVIASFH